jgi:BMFP domain-containing protein YqiC
VQALRFRKARKESNMQKDNKIFEDLAKMTSGAVGTFMDMKREMDAIASAQVEKMLQKMNLATKEECDTLREMVARLRLEQEELKTQLKQLQEQKKSAG